MHMPSKKLPLSDFRHLSLHVSPDGSEDEHEPYGNTHFIGGGKIASAPNRRNEFINVLNHTKRFNLYTCLG